MTRKDALSETSIGYVNDFVSLRITEKQVVMILLTCYYELKLEIQLYSHIKYLTMSSCKTMKSMNNGN